MALCIHALNEAVIEALLHAATRDFSSSHSLQAAQRETHSRANASPMSAVGRSAHGCAKYGADHYAAHTAVCCRHVGRLSAKLFAGELLADVVVSVELFEAFACAGKDEHTRLMWRGGRASSRQHE